VKCVVVWRRLSVRARLTAVYGTVLVTIETTLLAVVYLVMRYVPVLTVIVDPPVPAAAGLDGGSTAGLHRSIGIARSSVLFTLGWVSASSLVVVTAGGLLVCWIVAGRVLSPLSRITAAARSATAGTLDRRIGLTGPDDELKQLADTFDGMLARLEREFEANRRFAANASHELRTPLAVARTMLQVALADPDNHDLRELGPKLLATNARGIATTEALLVLASAQHGDIRNEVVDLAVLAADIAALVRPEARQRGVTVQTRFQPSSANGDPVLLRQLLLNLVQNAVRHNIPGGRAEVSVADMTLTVTNTGPVLPADSVDALFEPFHRMQARTRSGSGNGHGLGLAIVRAIADAHGASIHAEARPDGGLIVEVACRPSPARLRNPEYSGAWRRPPSRRPLRVFR
jgi:two-component system, OmpR family, sensor histidine kinase VanS